MKQEQKIVSFIAVIVVITISIQVYWNYIQYVNNRIQVISEIQTILDKVILKYTSKHSQKETINEGSFTTIIGTTDTDSIQHIVNTTLKDLKNRKNLNSNIINARSVSYTLIHDTINLPIFDDLLRKELKRKNYEIEYYLTKSESGKVTDSFGKKPEALEIITATAQTTPIESVSAITLNYANPVIPVLLKGLAGIISSFVLCCVVIFALYYLLHIIRKQKQLSEIKNDFISNVTHEFKTPIATVSSAIEAIKNFNSENISEKTKRYLDISDQQLKKLNKLVENVMETSHLESSELHLDKKNIDIINLLKDCVDKHLLNTQKTINLHTNSEYFLLDIDEFHFENAISNIIENAIKYGGNEINISVDGQSKSIILTMNDNGQGISKQDAPFIFDKFFRVKTQNIHTVKGFGIGLYYTKKIIENHSGTIELRDKNTFVITLWKK